MAATYRQSIGGHWVAAANGRTREVIDPSSESAIAVAPYGDAADCRQAVVAAAAAFHRWARETPYVRGAMLRRTSDLIREQAAALAAITTAESGKPHAQSAGEWAVAADLFEWFAEEGKRAYGRTIPSRRADKRMMVLKQPLGVVGVVTAWNFPIYNVARAAAAALAAGCTVVLRPSEYTPCTALELARIAEQAGLPPGVLNVICGEPEPMGQELLDNPLVRKIHLTGSPRVGRRLMAGAAKTIKRLSLELGGNAPVLVLPDVDVAAVARSAVAAKFRNCGQVCIAPQRFLVHRTIAEEFAEQAARQARAIRVGPGADPQSEVGPLINAAQRDHVASLVEEAVDRGARLLCGGKRPARPARGFFYEPTVLAEVVPEHRLFQEEAFGPVLPVTVFDELDAAIELANRTPYGLAAYVWTNDLQAATRAYERLEFGMVGVNEWAPQATEAPFCGWKESGIGHESGAEGLDEYLEKKLVSIGGL